MISKIKTKITRKREQRFNFNLANFNLFEWLRFTFLSIAWPFFLLMAIHFIVGILIGLIFPNLIVDSIASQVIIVIIEIILIMCLYFLPKKIVKKTNHESVIYKIFKKLLVNKKTFACDGHLKWRHINLAFYGLFLYMVLTFIIISMAVKWLPGFDIEQKQELGFHLSPFLSRGKQIFFFVSIVIIAPIIEEVIFRGYLFGQLSKKNSFVMTSLIVSVLFGVAHQTWNVGLDTFSLSMIACCLRGLSDSIYPGILLHMMKNGLAFFVLINIIN